MSDSHPNRYRSLFWPMILIGVGLVWLLANLGILPTNSLWLLANLWPLLLVGIGLDLIFARRLPAVGALIGLLLVGVVIVVLLIGPSLNLPQLSTTLQTKNLTVPLESNTSATVELNLSSYSTNIYALPDSSPNLFDGVVHYNGNLDFSANGSGGNMVINLDYNNFPGNWFIPGNFAGDTSWKLGLSPKVALNLNINAASGSQNIDLTGLKLSSLNYDGASGSNTLRLPVSSQPYTVNLHGASGSSDISLPAETNLTLHLDGASGSLNLNLPASSAVRVEVRDSGSGSINVRSSLNRVSGGGRDKTGTWESAGYAQSDQKLLIIVDNAGSGSINID
jgi:hypothetical protein